MPNVISESLRRHRLVGECFVVVVVVATAVRFVPPLGGQVEVFVNPIEKPEEELLGVVLVVALELGRVFLDERFEPDGNFWIVLKERRGKNVSDMPGN